MLVHYNENLYIFRKYFLGINIVRSLIIIYVQIDELLMLSMQDRDFENSV